MRAILLALVGATRLSDEAASLDLKERPVAKVIRLLKETQHELETEKANDEELYEKLTCWCETNEKEKTEAIAEAQRRITQLVADIAKGAGKSAEHTATIKQLEKEIAANEAALATATEVRAKEHAEFNQNEKDMVQAIESLKNAVLVLGKHNEFLEVRVAKHRQGANFLQVDHTLATVSALAARHAPRLHSQLKALMQQPAGAGQSYAPASGQIFGILKQMKEEFEGNLADSQQSEETAAAEFAELKKAKTNEINAAKTQVKSKTQGLADTDDQLAQDKEDLELTREALSSDTQFLSDLKLRCQQTDKDWELRTKTRNDEIAAISETIKILTDDDAHDTFGRTMNFLQVGTQTRAVAARAAAARVLRAAAQRTGNMSLLALSQGVKLDAFTKVKAAIDEMITGLKKEQADEVEQRDWCNTELHQNEMDTIAKENEKSDLEANIDQLASNIETLSGEIQTAQADLTNAKVELQRANTDRVAENKVFQKTVAEQRATAEILKKVLNRLDKFYLGASLVQAKAHGAQSPNPPVKFDAYKKSQGSSSVTVLIQNLIADAGKLEAESLADENSAQQAYEAFVASSNKAVAAYEASITNKRAQRAEQEVAKEAAQADLEAAKGELTALAKYSGDVHGACDFVTKNFDIRQEARSQEIEALNQATAILSGM